MMARSFAALLSLSLCTVPVVCMAEAQALPDYAVDNLITAPSPAQPGRSIVFKATVRNVSGTRGTERGNAVLKIDEGANGSWDVTSTRAIFGSLPVGSSATPSWGNTGTPPPVDWQPVVGTHRAQVCMHTNTGESNMYTQDSNAANDCTTLTFTIGSAASSSSEARSASSSSGPSSPSSDAPSLPDYILSAMDVTPNAETGTFDAWATVRNIGADSIKATFVILEHRRSGTTGWESIVPARDIPPLASGAEATGRWSNHGRGMQGTYRFRPERYEFRACADAWNILRESLERNCSDPVWVDFSTVSSTRSASSRSSRSSSARSSSVRSRARTDAAGIADTSLPNLVLRGVAVRPASIAVGGTWGARAIVVNAGATPSEETAVRLTLDEKSNGGEDFVSDVEMVVPPLRPGRRFVVNWTTRGETPSLRWTAIPGKHRVTLCVNGRGQSPEWNTGDNCVTRPLRVRTARGSARSSSSAGSMTQ